MRVSIRRHSGCVMVNVTVKDGDHSAHWAVKVIGPTPASVAKAITEARNQCAMLMEGIALSEKEIT